MAEPSLPWERPKPENGRLRTSDRVVLAGILFVLRALIQWREVPTEIGLLRQDLLAKAG